MPTVKAGKFVASARAILLEYDKVSVDINNHRGFNTLSAERLPPTERLLQLARATGALRPKDVRAAGVHPEYLRRLHERGVLRRSARGVYTLAEAVVTEHHDLVEAVRRVPHGVICLISALFFHGIGTQLPYRVWVAIDVKAWPPREGYPPIRLVRFSGRALTQGVDIHQIEGVPVRVTSPAKTIADCFKYRNKIGLDVALEALRDGWRERRLTMDELWRYAEIDRVANVMRPYLESLTWPAGGPWTEPRETGQGSVKSVTTRPPPH